MPFEKKEYLDELFDFLKIPSISADPNYKNDVKKAANAVGVFARILIAFLIFASGEESVVSLSSKPIILTAVLATSIG